MRLNDKEIRFALLNRLNRQKTKPRAIIEELRVNNGNAIADVVALYKEAHCYEIKGENDKIERISQQGSFYNTSFRKITLVTTENHLKKAIALAPFEWGIMIASYKYNNIIFRNIRASRSNSAFNKELATQTLWKSEMLEILDEEKHKRKPRELLARLISDAQRKSGLSNAICEQLIIRHNNRHTKLESH